MASSLTFTRSAFGPPVPTDGRRLTVVDDDADAVVVDDEDDAEDEDDDVDVADDDDDADVIDATDRRRWPEINGMGDGERVLCFTPCLSSHPPGDTTGDGVGGWDPCRTLLGGVTARSLSLDSSMTSAGGGVAGRPVVSRTRLARGSSVSWRRSNFT